MSLSIPILTTSSEIDTRVDDCSATAVVMKDDADKAQMMSVFLIMGLPPQAEAALPIGGDGLKIPTTGMAGCCARAACSHVAATPPTMVMNSRRLMGLTPRPRITELSIAAVGVGQWRASQQKGQPARPQVALRDPNWGGLLMENLQSLIAQILGVAFAILGKLND